MSEELNDKQINAYNHMILGENVFITGIAGTGKSYLINKFYRDCLKDNKKIALTSTTGTSALLIGGQTLHSYLGIGIGKSNINILSKVILSKSFLKKRWVSMEVLIIDEISMLSPELFDKLEEMARFIRRNDKPFGGIQLILSGDFFQLDPIEFQNSNYSLCFQANSWNTCIKKIIHLTENIRQNNKEFQECLNEIRIGKISEKSKELLLSCENRILTNDFNITPTKIFSINKSVSDINTRELNKLPEPYFDYELDIEVYDKNKKNRVEFYEKKFIGEKVLTLAVGAQVMLLHNKSIDDQLINGSKGTIIEFINERPVVKFLNGMEVVIDYHCWNIEEDDKIILAFHQIPLKLAYATTIHKSQGQTIDMAEIDLEDVFAYAQVYVALSRVKDHSCLCIRNLDFNKIKANPYVIEYYRSLEEK